MSLCFKGREEGMKEGNKKNSKAFKGECRIKVALKGDNRPSEGRFYQAINAL